MQRKLGLIFSRWDATESGREAYGCDQTGQEASGFSSVQGGPHWVFLCTEHLMLGRDTHGFIAMATERGGPASPGSACSPRAVGVKLVFILTKRRVHRDGLCSAAIKRRLWDALSQSRSYAMAKFSVRTETVNCLCKTAMFLSRIIRSYMLQDKAAFEPRGTFSLCFFLAHPKEPEICS